MSQGFSFDRRRINGPESSSFPVFEDEELEQKAPSHPRKGRLPADIRPIFLKAGLITQANGSAYIETRRTKMACAVYGPRQASKNAQYSEMGKLNVEVKFAPFSCTRRRTPNKDAEDRDVATLIQQSLAASIRLELFPKSTIDVFITVLENDGVQGCVASGSTVASTALAHAGIEMIGLTVGCAASVVGDEIWLDPSAEECESAEGTVVVSCMPALGTMTNLWHVGNLTPSKIIESIDTASARCTDIHQIVVQTLREAMSPKSI